MIFRLCFGSQCQSRAAAGAQIVELLRRLCLDVAGLLSRVGPPEGRYACAQATWVAAGCVTTHSAASASTIRSFMDCLPQLHSNASVTFPKPSGNCAATSQMEEPEKNMTSPFSLTALTLAVMLAFSQSASALQPGFFGDAADAETASAATADQPRAMGRVVAVDPKASRITLEYKPLPHLFLEGGTRIFEVQDAAPLEVLGPGDRVRFDVERDGRRYVVTHIENSN